MKISASDKDRFLQNKASAEEIRDMISYLKQHPDNIEHLVNEAEWDQFLYVNEREKETSGNLWMRILENKEVSNRRITFKEVLKIAAALLVLAGCIQLIRTIALHPAKKTEQQVVQVQPAAKTWLINDRQHPLEYVLEDGSKVILAPGSKIGFAKPFEPFSRNIELEGEGTFYAAKNKNKPFTVFTDKFSTTAIGTVFVVRSFKNDTTSSVKLLEGKVLVKNLHKKDSAFLRPGQLCKFNYSGNELVKMEPSTPLRNTKQAAGTTDGSTYFIEGEEAIEFKNTSLPVVFNVLSRSYKVTIDYGHLKLANRKLTGTYLKDQDINSILHSIILVNNLALSKDDEGYHISIQ